LRAEGKETEANAREKQGLAEKVKLTSDLYQKQEERLKSLTSAEEKDESAIKNQTLALERTGTALARTKTSMKEVGTATQEATNESRWSKFSNGIDKANGGLATTHTRLLRLIGVDIVARGTISAISQVKNGIHSLIEEGAEYNKEQQVMVATWNTLTGSADKGQAMVDSVNKISTAFGQSSDLTNELEQQFYHVFNQQAPTDQLTKSILTMADTIGMTADDTQRLGLNFTHMMTSTKQFV